MLDVKEMSKRLNVSKKTVYKYLKKHNTELNQYITKGKNNQKVLSEKGFSLLLQLTDHQEEKEKLDRNLKIQEIFDASVTLKSNEKQIDS